MDFGTGDEHVRPHAGAQRERDERNLEAAVDGVSAVYVSASVGGPDFERVAGAVFSRLAGASELRRLLEAGFDRRAFWGHHGPGSAHRRVVRPLSGRLAAQL